MATERMDLREPDRQICLLRVILLILALSLLVFQVRDVVEKYIDKKTTMSITTKTQTSVPMPLVTFYPVEGFNKIKAESMGIENLEDVFTREENLHLNTDANFRNLSYVLGRDFFLRIMFFLKDGRMKFQTLEVGKNLFMLDGDMEVTIIVYETYTLFSGLAYSVHVQEEMGMNSGLFSLNLHFNDTSKLTKAERPKTIEFFLSDLEERYGMFFNYWIGVKPYQFGITMGHSANLYWEKSIHVTNENTEIKCRNYNANNTVLKCSFKMMGEDLRAKFLKACKKVCAIAPMTTFMELSAESGENLLSCETPEEILCGGHYEILLNINLQCEKPCKQNIYAGRLQSRVMSGDKGIITLQFMLNSMDVSTHEEVLLFDFATFVGSFGGSLGLFVGFSFFDFTTWIASRIVYFISPSRL